MGYELYQRGVPILTLDEKDFYNIPNKTMLNIAADGTTTFDSNSSIFERL